MFGSRYNQSDVTCFGIWIRGTSTKKFDVLIGNFSTSESSDLLYIPGKKNLISIEKSKITLNGYTKSTNSSFTGNTYNMYIFALNGSNVANIDSILVSYTIIEDNNILKKFFVPSKQDNSYGMFDLIEGKFYPNQGTGKFTIEVIDD